MNLELLILKGKEHFRIIINRCPPLAQLRIIFIPKGSRVKQRNRSAKVDNCKFPSASVFKQNFAGKYRQAIAEPVFPSTASPVKFVGTCRSVYPAKSTDVVFSRQSIRSNSPPNTTKPLHNTGRPGSVCSNANLGVDNSSVGPSGISPRKPNSVRKQNKTRRSKRKSSKKYCNFDENKWVIFHNNIRVSTLKSNHFC